MFNWGIKHLETVLGKTITGIIGIFALGVFVMWAIPKYVVTTEIFEREVESIYNTIAKDDKCIDRKRLELEKTYWSRKKYDLLIKLSEEKKSPTIEQSDRIEEAETKMKILEEELKKIDKFMAELKLS